MIAQVYGLNTPTGSVSAKRRSVLSHLCFLGIAGTSRARELEVAVTGFDSVYIVSPYLLEDSEAEPEWLNAPTGARVPGPFPLPAHNRLQIGSGFRHGIPKPRVAFDAGPGTPLYDAYQYAEFWLVSETMRTHLLALDAAAFDWLETDTTLRGGEPGPRYWLADLVRYCDCLDREGSLAAGATVEGPDAHVKLGMTNRDRTFFRRDQLVEVSFFRLPALPLHWLCTEWAKRVLNESGLSNLSFFAVGMAV